MGRWTLILIIGMLMGVILDEIADEWKKRENKQKNKREKKLENYELTKSFEIDEEGNDVPIINLIKNNLVLLQISFKYDYEKGDYSNKIGDILIKHKIFRTEENIGVESTIDEFIDSYPDYYIWYTYISGMYVIESTDMKTQFLLDENGYIGKKELMAGDMVELSKEDFSSNTKIIAIRIY